jgi:lysozyme family protein
MHMIGFMTPFSLLSRWGNALKRLWLTPAPKAPSPIQPDDKRWQRSIDFVLLWEGGYVNDPKDPGGETNFGISKRSHPDLDIKNLTREQAIAIYKSGYWEASGSHQLAWPLCLMHFDSAVNLGVGRAKRLLGQANNDFAHYADLRRAYYRSLDNFPKYGRAWMRRVDEVVAEGSKPL